MSAHPPYETHLCVWWSRKEKDLVIGGPNGQDRGLTHTALNAPRMVADTTTDGWGGHMFEPSFVDELKRRGYDITTLKFSVRRARKSEPVTNGSAMLTEGEPAGSRG